LLHLLIIQAKFSSNLYTEPPTILFHGTTSNRASKIVGNQFYETQGFKKAPVFLAEDYNTARYFAFEKLAALVPNQPKSLTVVEFKIPTQLANDLGIGQDSRSVIGVFEELRFPDIPGGTGHERILRNLTDVQRFNDVLKAGQIKVRRQRVK